MTARTPVSHQEAPELAGGTQYGERRRNRHYVGAYFVAKSGARVLLPAGTPPSSHTAEAPIAGPRELCPPDTAAAPSPSRAQDPEFTPEHGVPDSPHGYCFYCAALKLDHWRSLQATAQWYKEHPGEPLPGSALERAEALRDFDRFIRQHGGGTLARQRGFVNRLARRRAQSFAEGKHPEMVDGDDLAQVGVFGLLQALIAYDPKLGVPFHTAHGKGYADKPVEWRIEDELKRQGTELALRERWCVERYMPHAMRESRPPAGVRLDDEKSEPAKTDTDVIEEAVPDASVPTADEIAERLTVEAGVARLPERERKVIELRYYRDRTEEEIAAQLGCSAESGYVRRLLRSAREHLALELRLDDELKEAA